MTSSPVSAESTERPGYPIESVDRALSLLLIFESTDMISVSEAGQILGVSRSTAYRLLNMLQYRGFVRQDARTKAYMAGPALLRVGLAAVRQLDVRAAVRSLLEKVVEKVDETAHIVCLQRADAFFLDAAAACFEEVALPTPADPTIAARTTLQGTSRTSDSAAPGPAKQARLVSE